MNFILPNGPLLTRCSGLFAGSARVDTKSQWQTQLPRRVAVSARRADHDRLPHQQVSLTAVRLAMSHLVLEALASFPTSTNMCFPMLLPAFLYWLIRKLLPSACAGRMYMNPFFAKATRMLGALYPPLAENLQSQSQELDVIARLRSFFRSSRVVMDLAIGRSMSARIESHQEGRHEVCMGK